MLWIERIYRSFRELHQRSHLGTQTFNTYIKENPGWGEHYIPGEAMHVN